MSAIETALEWPRFCYSNASLFDDTKSTKLVEKPSEPKKFNKRKVSTTVKRRVSVPAYNSLANGSNITFKTNNISDSESTISNEDEQLVPQGPASRNQSAAATTIPAPPESQNRFAFSDMMREMAKKYNKTEDSSSVAERPAAINPFPILNQNPALPNLQFDPLILRAAFSPYFPFPQSHQFPNLFPSLETLSSSHALSALASKKRSASDDSVLSMSDHKRQRMEEALDLSSGHQGLDSDDVDVDVLSVDSPNLSRIDPECWSVDQVYLFVANIESCQEYAQIFREHCIDGSALMELTESHLTGILGLKLGPAIRLKNSIKELQKMPLSPASSSNYSSY